MARAAVKRTVRRLFAQNVTIRAADPAENNKFDSCLPKPKMHKWQGRFLKCLCIMRYAVSVKNTLAEHGSRPDPMHFQKYALSPYALLTFLLYCELTVESIGCNAIRVTRRSASCVDEFCLRERSRTTVLTWPEQVSWAPAIIV